MSEKKGTCRNCLYSNPTIGFAKRIIKEEGFLTLYHICGIEEVKLDQALLDEKIKKSNDELDALGYSRYEDEDLIEFLF